MFVMFSLGGLLGPTLILAGLVAAFAYHWFRRSTPISPVHPPRQWGVDHRGADHRGCKFDRNEARRSFTKPVIDTTNIPAPDPKIAQILAAVSAADVEKDIRQLSGETPVTVGGAQVSIKGRNSYTTGVNTAMTVLEDFYTTLGGFTVSKHQYLVRGKKMYNLVAERKGSKDPNKVLIVGAHLDSTAGSPWNAEKVCPGADDDGSGTSALKRIAIALAKLNLGVSVRLVHFTGEEQGLWGSAVYSDKVAKEQIEVIGMLEMDMIGYCAKPGNRVDIHDDTDAASHELVVKLVRNALQYGLNLNVVDTHNHAVQGRSDHASFLDHGFKAVLISEEFSDDGFNPNYHSTSDRITAVNLPYTVEVIRMVLATVLELADLQ